MPTLQVSLPVQQARATLERIRTTLYARRNALAQAPETTESLRARAEAETELARGEAYERNVSQAAGAFAWAAAWLDVAQGLARIAAAIDARWTQMRADMPPPVRAAMSARCFNPGGCCVDHHAGEG